MKSSKTKAKLKKRRRLKHRKYRGKRRKLGQIRYKMMFLSFKALEDENIASPWPWPYNPDGSRKKSKWEKAFSRDREWVMKREEEKKLKKRHGMHIVTDEDKVKEPSGT